jgi:hypothetical protein
MAGGSNGYRAALVRHQLTPGLISSLPGTAGSPPFISFSISYPELPLMRNCTGSPTRTRGEARNALARAVFFYRLGEIRDRSFENQRYRASGLNLVIAAISLWNTVYLERAFRLCGSNGRSTTLF